jgi:signal transduction histidine kinase
MNLLRQPTPTDPEFLQVRVRLLAQSAIRMPLLLFGITGIVCLALRKHVPLPSLLLWLGLCQLAVIPRAIFSGWLLYWRKSPARPVRDYRLFIFFAALSGAACGASAPLFFPMLAPSEQAFIGMVLTGLVAGGVASSGSSPLVLAAYAGASLLPLGRAFARYGHDDLHLVTWLVLLFSIVMVNYTRDGKRVLFESFLIRRERDQAVARLEQTNAEVMRISATAEALGQAKTRVLAAASHDLRQPLHALSIYSAVLAANPTPATLREVAHNIDQLVRSLGALLDALLDLSQLDSNSFPVQPRALDLAAIARQVQQEFAPAAAAKHLALMSRLAPAAVWADPLLIERIVRNLLDNAIKYTDSGQIELSTEVNGDQARLCVQDSGKGIAPDQLARVFEEFYQVNNPGRDRSRGLGLGLSLVQRMVALLGAQIELQSEPGRGTCASLILPHVPEQAAGPALPLATPGQLHGKTILLIDDEAAVLASLSALLTLWGAHALPAATLAAAWQACANCPLIDLMIADLRLADGANGVALVRALHEQYGVRPTLFVTGETAPERLREAKAEGWPILQKPVASERLYTIIIEQISQP